MAKHIGIVACSAEGAALCYRTICAEAPDLMGEHLHPEITIHTHPLAEYMNFIRKGDWNNVADLMLSSVEILAQAGAQIVICPDNTIHQAYENVISRSPLPWLHIAEQVAEEALRSGYKRLGITGTKYLMTGPVYPEVLNRKKLFFEIPEKKDREKIDQIIFSELVNGRFTPESRHYFNEVFIYLKNRGCDAVILGCTEIPLLVDPNDSPLPTLDSTRLLARAALHFSLETE